MWSRETLINMQLTLSSILVLLMRCSCICRYTVMANIYIYIYIWMQPATQLWSSEKTPYASRDITLRPRQNGRHFADVTFKHIFLKENIRISIKISLKFVPKSPIDNIPVLFQIMAWRRPLSEAIILSLLTHICVARPQWDMPVGWRRHLDSTDQMLHTDNLWP